MTLMQSFHPIIQVLLGTGFTWGVTALGATVVFTRKELSRRALDGMLGFAASVMIAAKYWSLLAPAIEMSVGGQLPSWFPAATGFLLGGLFLRGADRLLPHLHVGGFPLADAEGIKTAWRRMTLLILAITLHNIPEGLAVGVAFGAVSTGLPSATLSGAMALALGIGLQNFPEGVAVAMPLRRTGMSRLKSFWYGQLSGIVEPLAGILGVATVLAARAILPYGLAFAAGAMVFVVIEEVIPEAQRGSNTDIATFTAMLGFTIMMILDVAFS